MLGGGDLDGDIYNLILNVSTCLRSKVSMPILSLPLPVQNDLFPERTSVAGSYIGLPHKITPHECTVDDIADFVIDYVCIIPIDIDKSLKHSATLSSLTDRSRPRWLHIYSAPPHSRPEPKGT